MTKYLAALLAIAMLGAIAVKAVPRPAPAPAPARQCAEEVVGVSPTYEGGMPCLVVSFVDGIDLILCFQQLQA